MIKNKLEKTLAFFSSLAIVVAAILGIKIKEDNKKLDKFENDLNNHSASVADILDTEKRIMAGREALLDKIASAPVPDATRTVTTQTVVPGKVVSKKIPVSSSSSSSSSSSKTTKSS